MNLEVHIFFQCGEHDVEHLSTNESLQRSIANCLHVSQFHLTVQKFQGFIASKFSNNIYDVGFVLGRESI